jgi:hypothetical protein
MKKWQPQRMGETRALYEARLQAFGASAQVQREKTKAKLNARHAKPGSLLAEAAGLPPRAQVRARFARFQPGVPPQVRKAATEADQLFHAERARMAFLPVPRPRKKPVSWLTGVPAQSRRHRATGKPKGRRTNEDIGLAAAVYALADNNGISLDEAKRRIAWALIEWGSNKATAVPSGKLIFSSAMNRVRKALLGAP